VGFRKTQNVGDMFAWRVYILGIVHNSDNLSVKNATVLFPVHTLLPA
jgi:hypothetical protein